MNSVHRIHAAQLMKQISVFTPKSTLREELVRCLSLAEGMAKQRAFGNATCERIADSGELLMLEYAEQLTILDAIDEGFIRPVEIKNTPEV